MKVYLIALTALLALNACGSDSADGNYKQAASEGLIDAQIDADTKKSVDSVAKATTDGKILFPLPDSLTTLLQQRQPQAQVATLSDQTLMNKRFQVNNPIFLRGNFDGNNYPDYAVQVLQNDSVFVLAFLDYTRQAREVKVAAYPAQKLNEKLYSTYQLKLVPQDSTVMDLRNQRQAPLVTDGISVLEDNRNTLYVLRKGRFIPLNVQQ